MGKMRKRLMEVRLIELLPEEIIEEILYKLPPKSLLRFKSVCKSWGSRISSPYFIKTHASKSSEIFAHQNLILIIRESPFDCLRSYSLQSFLDDDDVVSPATILDYAVTEPFIDGPLQIYGSCNGLILLATSCYGPLFLWNPSTRKARSIPNLHGRPRKITYGFGYNESADDYRIVCISNPSHLAGGPYLTDIYSLRNDSWKEIENLYKGATPKSNLGTFVNGRLHWIARYDDNGKRTWDIVCLDLGKERYKVVAKPYSLLSSSFCLPQCLRVLGGNLGLVCYMNKEFDMDVWVMKEYGVRESWVKILNISNPVKSSNICSRLFPALDGDGVLACESTLIFYDGQNNLRNIKADVVRESLQANVYVESLVSPFGKGDQPQSLASDLLPCWLKMLIR